MTNKYVLTVDGDPVVICDTIEQAVIYIMWDPHLNRAFKDWYEEERHAYGAIEYQEYIKLSIQDGDIVKLETVPILDNDTQKKKRYLIYNADNNCFLGMALTEEQRRFFEWLSENDMLRSSDILFTEADGFEFKEI